MSKSYYDILGVNKNASEAEIKKAFKKAAVKWHPDRQTGKSEKEQAEAEEMFKKINEANDVLSDPDKRRRYDQFGDDWDKVGQGGFGSSSGFDIDLGEMFSHMNGFGDLFGNRRQQQRGPEPGTTIRVRIALSIEDIFNGDTREIEVKVNVRCKDCNGTGGDKRQCPHCNGTGMITNVQHTAFGIIQNSHPCPHCHGTGQEIINKCSKCSGTGFTQTTKNIKINIRPGIQNGEEILYSGMGYESQDPRGANGDLIVQCVYNIDNSKYIIQGNDVFEKINVPYYDVILGKEQQITLPNGKKETIKIKPCSQEGDKITLYGKSFNHGNYHCIIHIVMPTFVSDIDKKLLTEIKNNH